LHLLRNSAARLTLTAAGVMLAVMWAGCENTGSRSAYVARVNNAVLRESDLEIARDSLGETAAMSREYVNNWIVTEMLYQEAERRGITDAIAFQQQLDMTRKRLAVAALIQQEVYASIDSTDIPDEVIVQSYTASGPSFALREDLVQASVVLFRDREGANVFRSKVLRGASWDEALRQMRADSAQRLQVVRTSSRQYYTRSRLYPTDLWKLARSLPREEVSFPLRTPEGYTVVRVHQSFRQGEIPPLEYVRVEVREYLLMDLRRQRYEEFVGALRGRHSVDIRESAADSGAILNKE
jgi:hypothetical protein